MSGKLKINFYIDALMFLVMMPLAGIGFLIKFVLIPGKERVLVYGRNVELLFLGLDRHEWGSIHLWIAYILGALLIAHICLHISWITGACKQLLTAPAGKLMALVFLAICAFMLLFSFFVAPGVSDMQGGHFEGHRGRGLGRMR